MHIIHLMIHYLDLMIFKNTINICSHNLCTASMSFSIILNHVRSSLWVCCQSFPPIFMKFIVQNEKRRRKKLQNFENWLLKINICKHTLYLVSVFFGQSNNLNIFVQFFCIARECLLIKRLQNLFCRHIFPLYLKLSLIIIIEVSERIIVCENISKTPSLPSCKTQ